MKVFKYNVISNKVILFTLVSVGNVLKISLSVYGLYCAILDFKFKLFY